MDYRSKYLKYKKKYLELKALIGGGNKYYAYTPQFTNSIYIALELDPTTSPGNEIISRLTRMGKAPGNLHISLFNLTTPQGSPLYTLLNSIATDPVIKAAFQNEVKTAFLRVYNNSIQFNSALGNYECYGDWIARYYDNITQDIIDSFRNFKIAMIDMLMRQIIPGYNFNTHLQMVNNVPSKSSVPAGSNIEHTHYHYKNNRLPNGTPYAPAYNPPSIFEINQYSRTPILGNSSVNRNNWVPHVSLIRDPATCASTAATNTFIQNFRSSATPIPGRLPVPISYINVWPSNQTKPVMINGASVPKRGSIDKIKINMWANKVNNDLSIVL